ncbi:type II secretion system protein GspC [Enterovibrio nigricans]|uniref:General secretion pathway protein C n=1 Tax=Enterovibrio nigricans DSM 22720 TaxID=1121868 RepID=A0A1T4UA47_9GAMM|nr:type II secretion system protein GspC [Enterovibrio nigricans]PKF51398.1 type II secretion system protein GspC [Enterovibrio nigricans]SKA49537.1 general secretion pathway protein C [Enterovibrio nigricans DSM 22720]
MFSNFGISRLANIAQPQLGKDFHVYLSKWVARLLILFLAWTLGRLLWVWFEPTSVEANSQPTAFVASTNTTPAYHIDQLALHQFFGEFNAKSAPIEPKPQPVVEAPKTKLNLTLVGLVASSEPERGLAVIANRGSQKTYGIGEPIEGTRVTLRQVLNDRVILRNNGRDEALMLAGVDYNQPNKAPVRKAPAQQRASSGDSDLSAIKAEIMNNPQALLKYLTLSREQNETGLIGYRIGPGSDSRLFTDAGLQTGDIAVGINGADLTNPAEMNRIWQSLSDASEISLTVQRGGQLHEIYISL